MMIMLCHHKWSWLIIIVSIPISRIIVSIPDFQHYCVYPDFLHYCVYPVSGIIVSIPISGINVSIQYPDFLHYCFYPDFLHCCLYPNFLHCCLSWFPALNIDEQLTMVYHCQLWWEIQITINSLKTAFSLVCKVVFLIMITLYNTSWSSILQAISMISGLAHLHSTSPPSYILCCIYIQSSSSV